MSLTHSIRRTLSKPFVLPEHTDATEFIGMLAAVVIRQVKVSLGLYDPLTRLAARHKSDKGVTVFPFHGYTINYALIFKELQKRQINMLEIGLSRRTDRKNLGATCPSLSMWLDYFPDARVFGFDIDDFSEVNVPRGQIFRGDQGIAEDLLAVVPTCSSFDVVIDDGSHASYHQQITMRTLFPYVKSGGLYIIEDLHWQPADLEASLPAARKMRDLLKDRDTLDSMIPGVRNVSFLNSDRLAVVVKD
jgi:hypothetical protein